MFTPERKLLVANLKKAMDYYYEYSLGTTKTVKSKPIPNLDLDDVDKKTTRFSVDTKILKIFNNVA